MSALMSQHEAWVAARARMGAPTRSKPRMAYKRPAKQYPLWVPTQLLLPPPTPDWAEPPPAPYDAGPEPTGITVADPGSYSAIELAKDPFRWRRIIEEVAAKHGLRVVDLCSTRRAREIVRARHEAMWRLRNETTMSLPAIGRKLGGRDHTTVYWGIHQHERRIEEGSAL